MLSGWPVGWDGMGVLAPPADQCQTSPSEQGSAVTWTLIHWGNKPDDCKEIFVQMVTRQKITQLWDKIHPSHQLKIFQFTVFCMGGKQEMCSFSLRRERKQRKYNSVMLMLILFVSHNSLQNTRRPQQGLNELVCESASGVELMKN